ncbi:MAG: GatB/YqeY domain-containing protein [Pseudomonadota bacterium]
MSELQESIAAQTKNAMKARDKAQVAVLRMVNAELKRVEVDERRELSNDDVLAILTRMVKQRKDALQQFRAAERNDLAEQEAYEISLIETFLPAQLDDDALGALIEQCIETAGAEGMQDMGKVMAALKQAAGNQVDMGKASALVKAKLGN